MKPRTVPDFFQQHDAAALRSQAQWLDECLGLDDRFLACLLRQSESTIGAWRENSATLQPPIADNFRKFWIVILHLLSHYNFDDELVRKLFTNSTSSQSASPLRPPWAGSSLRAFFERHPSTAIDAVNRWVMSFRFGDPYVVPTSSASAS